MCKWIRLAVLLLLFALMAGWYIPAQAYTPQIGLQNIFGQYAYIQTGHCKIEQITIINLDYTDEPKFWKFREPNRLKWADTLRANSFTWYNAVVWEGCK